MSGLVPKGHLAHGLTTDLIGRKLLPNPAEMERFSQAAQYGG